MRACGSHLLQGLPQCLLYLLPDESNPSSFGLSIAPPSNSTDGSLLERCEAFACRGECVKLRASRETDTGWVQSNSKALQGILMTGGV